MEKQPRSGKQATPFCRLVKLNEIPQLIYFLNCAWGSAHPVINCKEWFEYYYLQKEQVSFAVCEINGEFAAACGYIPASNDRVKDAWASFFVADKNYPGIGLELMAEMPALARVETFACNNIRPKTQALYRFLGWHTGRLNHFYCLADLKNYTIPIITNKIILPYFGGTKIRKTTRKAIEEKGMPLSRSRPRKDTAYFIKRYLECPFYQYDVWEVRFGTDTFAYIVTRFVPVGETGVVHIVDFCGEKELIRECGMAFRRLLELFHAEYIDCYCTGVPREFWNQAGMTERTMNDSNVIPAYLEPLEQVNTEYYFFTNRNENFVMFKADGDQDRPFSAP